MLGTGLWVLYEFPHEMHGDGGRDMKEGKAQVGSFAKVK